MSALARDDRGTQVAVEEKGTEQPTATGQPARAVQPGGLRELREVDLLPVGRSLGKRIQEADRDDLTQEALLKGLGKGLPWEDGRLMAYACVAAGTSLADLARKGGVLSLLSLEGLDLRDPAPGPDIALALWRSSSSCAASSNGSRRRTGSSSPGGTARG